MVSKLLLAVGETIQRESQNYTKVLERLWSQYMAIREGIGSHKDPDEYGAFPFDPYSHTPMMAGVQQPGMTGQVKEDIISRWFELGVSVHDGQLSFCPRMINPEDYVNGELHFTYCGAYVIYRLKGDFEKGNLYYNDSEGATLSKEDSARIFARQGKNDQIIVTICKK